MSKPFKLCALLYSHSLDVRSVDVTPDNSIISGSRDKTAKLWVSNGFNAGYNETITYKDQKHFVASVLFLDPSKEHPNGLIITGGNDNIILAYNLHEPFATLVLQEHMNTVCFLSKGVESNTFLSGSWDTTAKFWSVTKSKASLATYTGHTAAVWSVIQLQNTNVVTASADKTVGIYAKEGHRLNIIQGHTDCVRGLADFPESNCFISVSNDASIKVWNYIGTSVDTYYGHTNYIYSIARNKAGGENCFVTSDEDRTVRYWKDGVNTESFQLPAQSVWSVACLNNGDIVTGSSDGVVRVFTQDENRYINEQALKAFEEEVNALSKQSTQEIGGYKVSDLPGREALYEPGKRPGQMKMIREVHGVVAYTWVDEGENSHWEKVGDVLGGTDNSNQGKTMFEGKPYDYVFCVDVEDGKPPIKLPFNKGDDPYLAAHNFLQKNMLPPEYLDQVVDFIHKNSGEGEVNLTANSDFVDPFTGGARYTPNSGTSSQVERAGTNSDPFTGSSSYSSSHGAASRDSIADGTSIKKGTFYPQKVYRAFEMGDPNVILIKLKEFNDKYADGSGRVEESTLEGVVKLCMGPATDTKYVDILFQLFSWNDDHLFPVIDIIRLAARHKENNTQICTRGEGILLNKLKHYVSQESKIPNNTLVTFRALCNLFLHQAGEDLLFKERVILLENVTTIGKGNKNIQVGMATFLLNLSILCLKKNDEFGVLILASVIPDIIGSLDDPEAQFRAYVALGTLLSSTNSKYQVLVKEKIKENEKFVSKLRSAFKNVNNDIEHKTQLCVAQVFEEINK